MSSQPRTCAICGTGLYSRNRSGYCAAHVGQSPAVRAKNSAAQRLACRANPAIREAKRRAGRASASKPGERERRSQAARQRNLSALGRAALTPEVYKKIGASLSATRMGWCPAPLRDEYRRLVKSKSIPAAEARKIILEQHEAEMRRWRRSVGVEEPAALANCAVVRSKGQTDDETAARIIAEVAKAFRLSVAEVLNERRMAYLIPARQTCAFILLALGNSARQVGRWLDRDHATIRHSAAQFEARATPEMRVLARAFLETDA